MEDFKVRVVEFAARKFFMMQYKCPVSGRKISKSTKVLRSARKADRREAERVAAVWEADLQNGRYKPPSKTTWDEFRRRYENEALQSLAAATADKAGTVLDLLQGCLAPKLLHELTSERVSIFQAWLRTNGRSETTIKGYLAHLLASLRWANRVGLMAVVPNAELPRRAKGAKMMKGRPITGEEFERMLDKVEAIVDGSQIASWKRYLNGLWFSGLRLAESLELYWDRDDRLCVDLSRKRPILRIPAEFEKGNQDRLLPMPPEFAEFLQRIPEDERIGRVFKIRSKRLGQERLSDKRVCRIVAAIGKAAGIKVHTDPKSGKVKYASAHDLRRSFGERWAVRVMPQVLKELMRHEDISTTLKYYVGQNAQATAQILWDEHKKASSGNTSGNTNPKPACKEDDEISRK